jgi:hypothetical protein
MTKKRLIVLTSISIVLLLISIFFTYEQYQEIQRYEKFISNKLSQSLSEYVTAIIASEETLNQYISSGKKEMLPEQATNLCYNFETISKNYDELLSTAINLKKVNDSQQTNRITASVSQDIHFFLGRSVIGNGLIGDCSQAKSNVQLDEKKFEKVKEIYNINKQWSAIVKKYVPEVASNEVTNLDRNSVVNDKMWVKLLEEFSVYANQLGMTGINQFFN